MMHTIVCTRNGGRVDSPEVPQIQGGKSSGRARALVLDASTVCIRHRRCRRRALALDTRLDGRPTAAEPDRELLDDCLHVGIGESSGCLVRHYRLPAARA
jgi:hypothetical protein